jgi:glycosyltransferase involved in cell wall biosynthesis
MRVLQVITDRDRRGAQVFATDLERGLIALNVDVTTVALAAGTHGDLLPVTVLGPSRRSLSTLRALRSNARSADVVVAHGSATLLACAVALLGTGTPFVYRQISDPLHWAASWPRRLRVAVLVRRAAAVVVLSPSVREVFGRHYRLSMERMTVIPNAVPGDGFAPASSDNRAMARAKFGIEVDQVVFAYIGALAEEKGVDMAVAATATVPQTSLIVTGDGPERAQLQSTAERTASGRVHFTGPLPSAIQVLAAADVLILPSRGGDSMPAVLIEAGLCALPCVTTPVGAIPDVVLDGITGRVVPIGDQPQLDAAVQQLCEDRELRNRMGVAAVEHCRAHFTIQSTAPLWVRLLENVSQQTRRGHTSAARQREV